MPNGIASSIAALRVAGRTAATQISRDVSIEEEKERKAREKRLRGFLKGRGIGRLVGSLAAVALAPFTGGTSLLATSALAGGGSLIGQLVGTAGKKGRVETGTFDVVKGEEQERGFRDVSSFGGLAGQAGMDALSAVLLQEFIPELRNRLKTKGAKTFTGDIQRRLQSTISGLPAGPAKRGLGIEDRLSSLLGGPAIGSSPAINVLGGELQRITKAFGGRGQTFTGGIQRQLMGDQNLQSMEELLRTFLGGNTNVNF